MDISKLSPQEQRLYKLYGKLPTRSELLLNKKLRGGDRKFFDSGDYALSKAGKDTDAAGGNIDADIGAKRHPDPTDIPHHSSFADPSPGPGQTVNANGLTPINSSSSPNNFNGDDDYNQLDGKNTGSSGTNTPLAPGNDPLSSPSSSSTSSSSFLSNNLPTSEVSRRGSIANPIPTMLPPRSPHAAPASLQPGDAALSLINSHSPVTAQVFEPSTLLHERKE